MFLRPNVHRRHLIREWTFIRGEAGMKEGRIQGRRFLRRAPFPPFTTDKSISVLGRGVVHESAAGGRGQRPAGTSPAARGGTGPGSGRSPPPHGPGASSLPQARPAPLIFDPQVLLLKGGGTLPRGKASVLWVKAKLQGATCPAVLGRPCSLLPVPGQWLLGHPPAPPVSWVG